MKVLRIFLAALFAYLLVLIQTGLFFGFSFFGFSFPLVFLFVLWLAFFEKKDEYLSLAAAIAGGFSMEMYSEYPFGFYVLPLIIAVWIIKFILKSYVRFPAS